MNSIDFGGRRSEVKAMIAIIYKCGVRGDATLCVVIFFSSPEPKAQVSYCHSAPSVVRPSVRPSVRRP